MIHFFAGDSPERHVERLLAHGERLTQHGKTREAIEKFEEAATILPEASRPSLALGRAYCIRREYDLALKHYYKGLYFCEITDEPGILCEIAQVYLNMKRVDLAEEKLYKALRLDERFMLAIQGLAHIYFQTGRISEAIEQQSILQERQPQDNRILLKLVQSYLYLGEYENARRLLQEALSRLSSSDRSPLRETLERRLRESSFPDGTELRLKERLYATYGNICLGAAADNDNGLRVSFAQPENISTQALYITLRRLSAFVHAFSWKFTCVLAGEKNSAALAAFIASLLRLPVKNIAKVNKTDNVLVCRFYIKDGKQLRKLLKKIGRRTQAMMTFGFLAQMDAVEDEYMPDLLGLPVAPDTKLPWKNPHDLLPAAWHESSLFSAAHHPQGQEDALPDEFYALPPETALEEHLSYYRENPTLLRKRLLPRTFEDELLATNTSREEPREPLRSDSPADLYTKLKALHAQEPNDNEFAATLKALYHEHSAPGVRSMIIDLLLKMPEHAGVNELPALFDEAADAAAKIQLIDRLGQCSLRKASEAICAALRDPSHDVRACAAKYLAQLDSAAPATELHRALLNDSPDICVPAIRYLHSQHSELLYGSLATFLQHPDADVVQEALNVVETLQERKLTPDVLALLSSDDPQIIIHAILTLGAIGDIDCGYQLLPFLEHEHPELRYAAAASLAKLERQRSIVFLMERLRKESLDVQERLILLLGEVGLQETVPFIVQFAEQHFDSAHIVSAVMHTLALLKNPRSLPFVRKAASKFPSDTILREYIEIATAIGEEKDIETLTTFLEHPPEIQFRVAALLYRKGMTRYFRILQDGLRSQKLKINFPAVDVLADIGDEASLRAVFAAFTKKNPKLDRHISIVLSQPQRMRAVLQVFRALAPPDADHVRQGVLRAFEQSQTLQQALQSLQLYAVLQENEEVSAVRSLLAPERSSVLQRGLMTWLAEHDPQGSSALLHARLDDENIEIANTAYRLLKRGRVARQPV